jgi:hypothetical protein
MMYEEILLEMARLERELKAKVEEKIKARQLGLAFVTEEEMK